MVAMYCGSGDFCSATLLFHQVLDPSARLYNALIRGHSLFGAHEEILPLFYRMHSMGLQPDHFTFPFVLKCCANLEAVFMGRSVHALCSRLGLEVDIHISTSLIDMYVKCSNVPDARRVFELVPFRDVSTWNALIAGYMKTCEIRVAEELFGKMPQRNIVSWTAMISGYTQNGLADRALALFEEMMGEGSDVKPNWVTIMSVLPACAHSSALEYGEKIHKFASSVGLERNPCVCIALVAMYARCGSLLKARSCFDQLRDGDRDVVAWNTMITGYSLHGRGADALSTFDDMVKSGTPPDEISFIGLLSGCSHSGLVDVGLKYFNAMESLYSVKPRLQHYACVVDLLGRAGRLAEAKKLIDHMPIEPGPSVWGALLAACRWHRELEIGEIAAEKLFELEPGNTGNFVLLSNMYAEARRWQAVDSLRAAVKDKSMPKNPGCSWIELHGRVHSFLNGDTSHQQVAEIYGAPGRAP
ncbi:unnamed protein product [Spirodela intermedia]|uniref:Uncharacterized protein n=1 Tax=Spirodela intermedia TaxID=51605 RepID=A0A7I8K953_SPIIN|nr:unnamed protein product [Spirodela intermedia]